MNHRISRVLLGIVFAMLVVVTGNKGNVVYAQEVAEPVLPQTEQEVAPPGMYRSELTNEWISESLRYQRPIAAMVDNEKASLPHYGISQADVVYEMMNSTANGRITRLMVLVKDWASITRLGYSCSKGIRSI